MKVAAALLAMAMTVVLAPGLASAQGRNRTAPAPPPRMSAPAGLEIKPVALTRVDMRIDRGRRIGSIGEGIGVLCLPTETVVWTSGMESPARDLERIFSSGLRDQGFKVTTSQDDLFETAATASEISVAAIVSSFNFTACANALIVSLRGKMDVEWQVYSRLEGRVVATIPTTAEFSTNRDMNVPSILALAFEQATAQLSASPAFRAAVVGAPRAAGERIMASTGPLAPIILPASAAAQPLPISDAVGSVVAVFAGDGHGSGFLVSSEGHLLTNDHVVGDAKFVKVRWSDGFETVGEVVRSDRRRDVALVKTDPRGRQPLGLRTSSVQPGEDMYAIGTPLDPQLQNTVTRGIASANRILDGFSFLQSDVTINGGNSGGPLIDKEGRVVAICVSSVRMGDAPTGINLFIPIRDALDFLALKVG